MIIGIGSDERTHLTDCVVEDVKQRGHEIELFGPLADSQEYWPAVAQQVAERMATGDVDEGVLLCWTGTGVCLAANKVPGVRAALCDDAETARGARLWNNANVLCLSIRRLAEVVAKEILDAWFGTVYQPNDEDDTCLEQLAVIEEKFLRRQPRLQ
jgi:ribose 5-phosphate isomerase B